MSRAGADLVFEVLPDARLVVSCQTRFNPSDSEWELWLMATGNLAHQVGYFRLLVLTEGGHPTKTQLERVRAENKTNPPTAIVSPSLSLRFLGAALTFVNPTIRCFAPAQLEKAFDHLGLALSERHPAHSAIDRLQRRLGVPTVVG
jgi:hypothetical protein